MYYLLSSKRFKQPRNQVLHLKDETGRTYCQTENVKRKGSAEFILIEEPEGRPVCKVCVELQRQRFEQEPRLSVLMGEAIEVTHWRP